MSQILLTGFEPWGDHAGNPSGDVALALGGEVLPVAWSAAERKLRRLLGERKPDAVVMLGLAEGRRRVEVEAVALNVDHHEAKPWRRWRKPIGKGRALALPSRLPVDRLVRALRRARIPAAVSHHAGTFLCNHVFYVALSETRVPCGSVHLPPTSALPLPEQVRAAGLILRVVERQA
jgi:pyroglutamyl-peptidase